MQVRATTHIAIAGLALSLCSVARAGDDARATAQALEVTQATEAPQTTEATQATPATPATQTTQAAQATQTAQATPPVQAAPTTPTCSAKRPVVLFNRWQEDWSVLKNPCVTREPLDGLKYIPLGSNPDSYLSLGANLRERLEVSESPLFGLSPSAKSDTYLIQRAQVHADAHIDQNLQLFVQLEDARAFDKDIVRPTDKNPLDLEQAFAAWVSPLGGGTIKLRVGRQEMAFDLQRFISVRDGGVNL